MRTRPTPSRLLCVLPILAIVLTGSTPSGFALRPPVPPAEAQTTNPDPLPRALQIKLPLLQPMFHWCFNSREAFLSGRLELSITRNDMTEEILVFDDGEVAEGWETMDPPKPTGAGEIYFGFRSSTKFATAPGDRITITLDVPEDLDGIGALHTGVLPAGHYTSEGTYAALFDTYELPAQADSLPQETRDQLHQLYDFTAFLEHGEPEWPLTITGDKGWLPPDERAQMEQLMTRLRQQDEARLRQGAQGASSVSAPDRGSSRAN